MKKSKENKNTFEKIYDIVRKIPAGKVATYGQIAHLLGNPRLSRVVGYAMHSCLYDDVPCHRVVNRFGQFAKSFEEVQRGMLEREGVVVGEEDCVDLKEYIWNS